MRSRELDPFGNFDVMDQLPKFVVRNARFHRVRLDRNVHPESGGGPGGLAVLHIEKGSLGKPYGNYDVSIGQKWTEDGGNTINVHAFDDGTHKDLDLEELT